MEGFEEKKWFVYVSDHHEGPFSLADVQPKLAVGEVGRHSYVWCEGMGDWKPMHEVAAFEQLLGAGAAPEAAVPMGDGGTIMAAPDGLTMMATAQDESSGPKLTMAVEAVAAEDEKTDDIDPKARKKAEKARKKAEEAEAKESRRRAKEAKILGGGVAGGVAVRGGERFVPRLIRWLAFLLVLAGVGAAYVQGYLDPVLRSPALKAGLQMAQDFARPYLIQLVEKVPALGQWISPIPSLDDVASEDYEDLKSAALVNPKTGGPRIALALARADPLAPAFYASSNLPDGAELEIYVEGLPETLLNLLGFSGSTRARIEKLLGKSGVLRQADGKPLPRGEYVVYVMEADKQPPAVKEALAPAAPSPLKTPANLPKGRKAVAKKTYFLGGAKDAPYQARLKEFHDRLRQKAQAELTELKQHALTLEAELGDSAANFARLRKGKTSKAQQKAWNYFHGKWTQKASQLSEAFSKWTPEVIQNNLFYGVLFGLVQQASQAIVKVHGIHHSFFAGGIDAKSFEIQLGEANSQAQQALGTLKAKVDQAGALPPTPSGMPRRDGL